MFKRLILVMFLLFFTSFVFAQERWDTLTFSTYYPAPYGSYNEMRTNSLRYGVLTSDPYACDTEHEGATYYNTSEKKIYLCDGTNWGNLVVNKPLQLIGEATMVGSVTEMKTGGTTGPAYNWFLPVESSTAGYNLNSLSATGLVSILSTNQIKFSTKGSVSDPSSNLTAGNYKIVYGGGKISYFMGKKFTVSLMIWRSGLTAFREADRYDLNNPNASDGVMNNFESGEVEVPVREATYFVENNWDFKIQVKFTPMTETLTWEEEIGPQFPNTAAGKTDWVDVGSPVFNLTTDYACNANMIGTKCGQNPVTTADPDGSGSFKDYRASYNNLITLNTRAGGRISDMTVTIYKTD